jgi:hypothetical protein
MAMTRPDRPDRAAAFLALVMILFAAHGALVAQTRSPVPPLPAPGANGGGSESTDRFISAVVYASWLQHWRASDGDTRSLLILWRGSPGWFAKRPPGGGRSSSGGGSGSSGWQRFTAGGMSFDLDYDFDRNVVKLLNQEVSLIESNVVLVDFVDSPNGAQIVDRQWIEPPLEQQPPMPDPIFAIVKSSPRLYEYVRCDVSLPSANSYISDVMSMYCAQMRPQ